MVPLALAETAVDRGADAASVLLNPTPTTDPLIVPPINPFTMNPRAAPREIKFPSDIPEESRLGDLNEVQHEDRQFLLKLSWTTPAA